MTAQLEMLIIKPDICPSFERCKAPLCPLDKSFNLAVWYPDEPICGSRKLPPEIKKVIKTQRRIAKRAKDKTLSYDLTVLKGIKRVDSRIKGRNSDTARKPRMDEALVCQRGGKK